MIVEDEVVGGFQRCPSIHHSSHWDLCGMSYASTMV